MKKRRAVSLLVVSSLVASLVGTVLPEATIKAQAATKEGEKMVTIAPQNASTFNNGKFEGWGTSFCWWANR